MPHESTTDDTFPIYAPLDPEIEPLIDAMNRHDWINTIGSCFGHEDRPHAHSWYVMLWCRKDHLGNLIDVLRAVESRNPDAWALDLNVVWSDGIGMCQADAEPHWLSLDLNVSRAELPRAARQRLTDDLTTAFSEFILVS